MDDLNHVNLTGMLERDPVTRLADHGTQQVGFSLRLVEAGPAGQAFKLFVNCEAYGKAAEAAGELRAGDSVLVAGELKYTSFTDKQGQKQTRLCVLARLVRLCTAAALTEAATSAPGSW